MLNDRSSILSLLETRRSGRPRDLIAPGPSPEELDRILAIAARTPDHGKLHPWRFVHIAPDGETRVIEVANEYGALAPDRRTVLLKVHGQVDRRPEREWESFVVSEDDYIDYLAQTDLASLVPVTLTARLRRSHFLFLDYPQHEWNFRVFLHRVWGRQKVSYRSWAVEPRPDQLSREFWRHVDVELLDVPLEEYVRQLETRATVVPAR